MYADLNYVKITTANNYQLLAKSMNKVHEITHFAFNDEGHSHLFNRKDLIAVSSLGLEHDVDLMALRYSGDRGLCIEDKSTSKQDYTNLYLRTHDGNHYQIAGVFVDANSANEFMLSRDDVALIDSTEIKGLTKQYHFVASISKSKTKIQSLNRLLIKRV